LLTRDNEKFTSDNLSETVRNSDTVPTERLTGSDKPRDAFVQYAMSGIVEMMIFEGQ